MKYICYMREFAFWSKKFAGWGWGASEHWNKWNKLVNSMKYIDNY